MFVFVCVCMCACMCETPVTKCSDVVLTNTGAVTDLHSDVVDGTRGSGLDAWFRQQGKLVPGTTQNSRSCELDFPDRPR